MAHGDFVEPVSEDEAEAILDLMSEVLIEVFQSTRQGGTAEGGAAGEGSWVNA